MNVAVMQPCYLPWRGYLALMRHADVFVHLDDVALPRGRSVQTRVQVKTAAGIAWLTLPVRRGGTVLVRDAVFADDGWRRRHARTLAQELPASFDVVADLYDRPWTHLAEFTIAGAERLAAALGVVGETVRSSTLAAPGTGTDRLLALCRTLGADTYLTGHGGRAYLDHERFEAHGIEVRYLDYDVSPYPQPHGAFTPFVTALDVLAHAPDPAACTGALLVPWRTFLGADAPTGASA